MPITGNTAKMMVIERLKEITAKKDKVVILNVDCGDLNLWIDAGFDFSNLIIHGIDMDGKTLEIAKQNAKNLAKDSFYIYQAKINELPSLFNFKFDIVVSTQVLEHLKDLESSFRSIRAIMKDGSVGLFTLDSGYYKPRISLIGRWLAYLFRLKRRFGNSFYVRPLKEEILQMNLEAAGLELVNVKHYALDPLKYIHNHLLPAYKQDKFASEWKRLEDLLNEDREVIEKIKHNLMALYVEVVPARKGTTLKNEEN
ncbi:MAG: class I SAM-dependent methyltransferase [Nitrososphaeraceae archaeon]